MKVSLEHIESVNNMRDVLPDLLSVHEWESAIKIPGKNPKARFGWRNQSKVQKQIPKTSNVKKLEQKLKKLKELYILIKNDKDKYSRHPLLMDIWS
jgi:hypothetical protein